MIARRILLPILLCGVAACSNASGEGGAEGARARAVAALEQGQPRTARVELLNAIKAAPSDGALRILQARVYLALGDGVAAAAEIDRARALGVAAGETSHLLAHAFLLQNEPERAIKEAEAALPRHAGYAARIRGQALVRLGDVAGAAAAFDAAVAAAPGDNAAWIEIARLRRSSGDLAGAIAAADKALKLAPNDVDAISLRGELTRGQYGLQAAMPWFDRALEIDPEHVTALVERAATLGDLGRMTEMLAETRKVQSLSPENPMAYYLQAMLAARAGDFSLAGSLYRRTRGAMDDQPAGMLLAGAIDYRTGNIEQAVKRLERLAAIQPHNRKARRLLAAAQFKLGDMDAVIATLRPIAEGADADSYSLTLIGRALAKQGDAKGASAFLARAARPQQRSSTALWSRRVDDREFAEIQRLAAAEPGQAPAQIALIGALLSRGMGQEALARALALQSAHPGVPDAHILVGDARGIGGDFKGAAEEYRKAANIAFTEPVAMRTIEALERSGQAKAATEVLQLFLHQNPQSVPAQQLAAARYMAAGSWPEAIRIYEGLRARLGDGDAVMLNNLAWAYAQQGDTERALPLAERAWTLDKDNPATADTYGWLLFKTGKDRARGLALLERASRGAPTDAEIRAHLEAAKRS